MKWRKRGKEEIKKERERKEYEISVRNRADQGRGAERVEEEEEEEEGSLPLRLCQRNNRELYSGATAQVGDGNVLSLPHT